MTDAQAEEIARLLREIRNGIPDVHVWIIAVACMGTCVSAYKIEQAVMRQTKAQQEATR